MTISGHSSTHEHGSPLPPPLPIVRGVAALDVERQHERRLHATRRSVPHVAEAWIRGSFLERRLANHLDRTLGVFAVVLHHRVVPMRSEPGSIDHIVVAASGVWVVGAQHDTGRISRGSGVEHDVLIDGRDRTSVATEMTWRTAAVQACVDRIGFDWIDVVAAACFTNGKWGPLTKAFQSHGTWILWPKALTDRIAEPGPLRPADVQTIAAELSTRLPAAR